MPTSPQDFFRISPRAVAALRHEAGLTALDVAVALGRSSGTVSGWESGDHLPAPQDAEGYLAIVARAAAGKLQTLPTVLAACTGQLDLSDYAFSGPQPESVPALTSHL